MYSIISYKDQNEVYILIGIFHSTESQYAMWSREFSLKLNMWHFQFSIWLSCSFREVHFAENPIWIRSVVPKLWAIKKKKRILKIIENKRNAFLFWLYLTINDPDFRLIPQDRNTYNFLPGECKKKTLSVIGCRQESDSTWSWQWHSLELK